MKNNLPSPKSGKKTLLFFIELEIPASATWRFKTYANWKRRYKTIIMHRQHSCIYRKPWRVDMKATRTNKQGLRIQAQYKKVGFVYILLAMNN